MRILRQVVAWFRAFEWLDWPIFFAVSGVIGVVAAIILQSLRWVFGTLLDIPYARMYTTFTEWYTEQYDPFLFDGLLVVAVSLIAIAVLLLPLLGIPRLIILSFKRRRAARRRLQHSQNRNDLAEINRQIDADRRRAPQRGYPVNG